MAFILFFNSIEVKGECNVIKEKKERTKKRNEKGEKNNKTKKRN